MLGEDLREGCFRDREQQPHVKARRPEERASVGGFLAAALCDLIYPLKRSLWLRLENGL